MSGLSIENLGQNVKVDPIGGSTQRMTREVRVPDIGEHLEASEIGMGSGGSFADMLKKSFETVNTHQVQADRSMQELVAGRTKNIHETMLAVERADMSLKLLMQVRNKILDAYREIMRMQV